MVSKELRKLSRRELIEVIYQMKKNEQQMQEKITALEAALEEKRLRISKAGSVAEAAVSITNVLNAAQEAADLYLHEIACMKAEAERECGRIIAQARNTASGVSPAPKVPVSAGSCGPSEWAQPAAKGQSAAAALEEIIK